MTKSWQERFDEEFPPSVLPNPLGVYENRSNQAAKAFIADEIEKAKQEAFREYTRIGREEFAERLKNCQVDAEEVVTGWVIQPEEVDFLLAEYRKEKNV